MKKAIIIIIVVLVLAAIAGIILKKHKGTNDISMVTVDEARTRDIEYIVTAFGQVTPRVEVEISSKVTGEITGLYVEEGDSVHKGDTLLQIDKAIYEAKVEQARASLKSAQASLRQQVANLKQNELDLERKRQMIQKGLISKNELERLETQFEVQKAVVSSSENSVEQARSHLDQSVEELSYTTIRSPQKGIVIGLSKEAGEYVIVGTMNNPGSIIMTVAQLDSMEVKVQVDETDVVELEEGQRVKISFDAISDTIFAGVVRKIGNKATVTNSNSNQTIANFPVEISIIEVPEKIRSGMSVTTEIITEHAEDVVSVPIQSIISGLTKAEISRLKAEKENIENKEFVFINENGIAKKIEVETGISDANYIEMKSGIEEGDVVITGPYQEIRNIYDGKPIEVNKNYSFD
ncbi:MAG: efflux RND transporter periplasmic adaptor subunit [Candidatus Zixiibacteriota bacterium]